MSPKKWNTRVGIAPTIHTADPVGMGRKSRQCTIIQLSVQARLSAHTYTDWMSCMFLAHLPHLPFCGLIYIHLLHL